MRYHDLPIGEDALEIVNAVIEMPQGSGNGYEYNAVIDSIVLDRVFASPLCYPTDYGWIPGTLSKDGDPMDILVFVSYPTFPGCVIRARSIGAVHTHDRRGEDYTIDSAARPDPRYDQVASLDDLPKNALREIDSFFTVCRQLDCEDTEIIAWLGSEPAHEIIREAAKLHRSSASSQH